MWLAASIAFLAAAIVAHAVARRIASGFSSIVSFLVVGSLVGAGLVVFVFDRWGTDIASWSAILVYAFACEVYMFLFTSVGGSISASLLYQLRAGVLSSAEVDRQIGGRAMVERRLAKMSSTNLLAKTEHGYSGTMAGARLLWLYRHIRNFFWRPPLIPHLVTRTDPGPLDKEALATARTLIGHAAALAALAAIPILLFWPHLSGEATFIGDSDRLNHFLSILKFLTEGYRDGRIPTWSEHIFGGFPVVPFTMPYPTSLLHLLWPPEKLFAAAGVISCLLVILAGWAAYAFISDLRVGALPAFTGASLYILCAFGVLKISQNDITYSAIVLIPVGMLVIRNIRPGNLARSYLALFLVMGYLMTFAFLQKTAYALLLFAAYAAFLGIAKRDWRIPVLFAAAGLNALLAALPRIFAVGEDFLSSARYNKEAYRNFSKLWSDSGWGVHEALRWFDDRIFGRFYIEAISAENRINLHEGMLLYMSAFAAFFILYEGFKRRKVVLAAPARGGDTTFFAGAAAFCFLAVVTKFGYFLVYMLFLKIEFIHTRICVAAMLPLTALVAKFLHEEFREQSPRLRFGLLEPSIALVTSVVIIAISEYITSLYGVSTVRIRSHHLMEGALSRIFVSFIVFIALIWVLRASRYDSRRKGLALYTLAFLMIGQAMVYGKSQISGEHMRDQWPPFRSPVRLLADRGQFSVPSTEATSRLSKAVETEKFRSSFVCPPNVTGILCATHLAHFWNLRSIDGYLYAVPARIAQVPWGPDALSLRALMFTDLGKLPWGLLGLYNVKYAIELSPEFMTNAVKLGDGGYREVMPDDLRIHQNPHPVAPRAFFTRSIVPVNDAPAASTALLEQGVADGTYDPRTRSFAEGVREGVRYKNTGDVAFHSRDDSITLDFSPSSTERFLVVNERYDPRWTARAGRTPLHIYPTNIFMRGLAVPPGASQVVLQYVAATETGWAFGCYAGAIVLLVLSLLVLFKSAEQHRNRN
jgi:hypothetical protein